MKECCETEVPGKKKYWHWVALGGVVLLAGALQVIPQPRSHHAGGVSTKASTDVSAILQSLTEYAIHNQGSYPSSLEPLVTPDANGHCYLEGYNQRIPRDPWKHEYLYEPPTPEHPKPRVRSLGADGKRGGSGDDGDIDSDRLDATDR
jgi:general secretion pathway protein G